MPPIVDMPVINHTDKDISVLAAEMSDTEMRAILIEILRYQLEIVGFVRDLKDTMNGLSQNGGMMGKMMSGMLANGGGSSLFVPPGK